MSKTIEDRATKWRKSINGSMEHECGYEQGATDQRSIDIESVCKWLEENFESLQASQDRRSDRDNFLEDLKMMDIFYETPRLPMFFMMEDNNLVRVRALKYVNGHLDSVLADWDADIIQDKFYDKDDWNDEWEEPFYCLYKYENGLLYKNCEAIEDWAEKEEERWEGRFSKQEIYDKVIEDAKKVGCPIFDSIEEARKYVFNPKYVINFIK